MARRALVQFDGGTTPDVPQRKPGRLVVPETTGEPVSAGASAPSSLVMLDPPPSAASRPPASASSGSSGASRGSNSSASRGIATGTRPGSRGRGPGSAGSTASSRSNHSSSNGGGTGLFEQFLIVSIRDNVQTALLDFSVPPVDDELNGVRRYEACVRAVYPVHAKACDNVELFCFADLRPSDEKLNLQKALRVYCFVLTSGDGEGLFGYCLRRCPSNQATPEVACFLTKHPWHSMFSSALLFLDRCTPQDQGIELRRLSPFLQAFHTHVFPFPSESFVLRMPFASAVDSDGQVRSPSPEAEPSVRLQRPPETGVHLGDHPTSPLLQTLSPSNLVAVMSAILLERKVLLLSSDLAMLSSCVMALASLLHPFMWPHILVPILPKSLLNYICVSEPFIIGALLDCEAELADLPVEAVYAVNLDDNATMPLPPELELLPNPAAVEAAISKARAKLSQGGVVAGEEALTSVFITLFLDMFGLYREHVLLDEAAGRSSLSRASLVAARPRAMQPFMQQFVRTKMFDMFVTAREAAYAGSGDVLKLDGPFEQRIEAGYRPSDVGLRGKIVNLATGGMAKFVMKNQGPVSPTGSAIASSSRRRSNSKSLPRMKLWNPFGRDLGQGVADNPPGHVTNVFLSLHEEFSPYLALNAPYQMDRSPGDGPPVDQESRRPVHLIPDLSQDSDTGGASALASPGSADAVTGAMSTVFSPGGSSDGSGLDSVFVAASPPLFSPVSASSTSAVPAAARFAIEASMPRTQSSSSLNALMHDLSGMEAAYSLQSSSTSQHASPVVSHTPRTVDPAPAAAVSAAAVPATAAAALAATMGGASEDEAFNNPFDTVHKDDGSASSVAVVPAVHQVFAAAAPSPVAALSNPFFQPDDVHVDGSDALTEDPASRPAAAMPFNPFLVDDDDASAAAAAAIAVAAAAANGDGGDATDAGNRGNSGSCVAEDTSEPILFASRVSAVRAVGSDSAPLPARAPLSLTPQPGYPAGVRAAHTDPVARPVGSDSAPLPARAPLSSSPQQHTDAFAAGSAALPSDPFAAVAAGHSGGDSAPLPARAPALTAIPAAAAHPLFPTHPSGAETAPLPSRAPDQAPEVRVHTAPPQQQQKTPQYLPMHNPFFDDDLAAEANPALSWTSTLPVPSVASTPHLTSAAASTHASPDMPRFAASSTPDVVRFAATASAPQQQTAPSFPVPQLLRGQAEARRSRSSSVGSRGSGPAPQGAVTPQPGLSSASTTSVAPTAAAAASSTGPVPAATDCQDASKFADLLGDHWMM